MKPFVSQDRSFWGFKYAFQGLWHVLRTESHFRFHICAAVGTAMFTEYYDFSRYDYIFLALAVILVLSSELINTAVEHTVDLCISEYSPLAKTAKDASAAFVLVCSFFALAVAAMLFLRDGILPGALLDILTRVKYIVFFVFTVIFVKYFRKKD